MAKRPPTFAGLASEYTKLIASMVVLPSKEAIVRKSADAIINFRTNYLGIQVATGVPWAMIGVIHSLECSLSFKKHLHCGDPLTARTKRVPIGHPKAPPKNGKVYSWEESAIDALKLKGLDKVTEWTSARTLYELERYNGFGHRMHHPEVLSPYLWSMSNHYTRGKYVKDGKWSAKAVSAQVGAVPLLQRIAEIS